MVRAVIAIYCEELSGPGTFAELSHFRVHFHHQLSSQRKPGLSKSSARGVSLESLVKSTRKADCMLVNQEPVSATAQAKANVTLAFVTSP